MAEPTNNSLSTVVADDPEAVIQSLLPFGADNKKGKYIGYRASGFEIREALKLVGIHEKTLHRWRAADPQFVAHEASIAEYRKTLGVEYAHVEFLRNYRLILQKDFEIIAKSIRTPHDLDKDENAYLLKARGHYTPQQLEILQALIGAKQHTPQFNFTQFILSTSRNTSGTARANDEEVIEGEFHDTE
jgi:hypothetical protein